MVKRGLDYYAFKNQWFLNIAMIAFSWLSLSFYGWRNKKFLPTTLLVLCLEAFNVQIFKKDGGFFIISQNHMLQGNYLLVLVRFLHFRCGY